MTRCFTKRKRGAGVGVGSEHPTTTEKSAVTDSGHTTTIPTNEAASTNSITIGCDSPINGNDGFSARRFTAGVCSFREDNEPKSRQSSLLSFFTKTKRTNAAAQSKTTHGNNNDMNSTSSSSCCARNTKTNRAYLFLSPIPSSSLSHLRDQNVGNSAIKKSPPTIAASSRKWWKPKSKSLKQVYIDCGQSKFGQILCDKCGMLYVPGVAEDELQHKQLCQAYKQGIPCIRGNIKGGKLLLNTTAVKAKAARGKRKGNNDNDGETVILWRPSVNNHSRNKSKQQYSGGIEYDNINDTKSSTDKINKNLPSQWPLLAQMISKDLGTNEDATLDHLTNQIVLLYIGNNNYKSTDRSSTTTGRYRILGVATVQVLGRKVPAYEMISLHERSLTPVESWEAKLGIGLLWTHPVARQRGIATRLVDAARDHAIFGMKVAVRTEVAFSSPTQAGYSFALRYSHGGIRGDEKNRDIPTNSNENIVVNKGCNDQEDAIHPQKQLEEAVCRKRRGPLVYEMDL